MRKYVLFLISFTFLILGCKKEGSQDPVSKEKPQPPHSIQILSGNSQWGFPNIFLPDSIVLKIIPQNLDDLDKYAYYCVAENGNYPQIVYGDTIINNELYVSILWRLNNWETTHKMTFYLTVKESDVALIDQVKLDSVSLTAYLKQPWIEIHALDNGDLYDMHFSDDMNGIVVGGLTFQPGYLETNDGGETFTSVPNNRKDLYMLSFADPDTGIVILTNNYALYTHNGGQSFFQGDWTPPMIGHLSSQDYFMFNSKKMMSVGTGARISRTFNGGDSWEEYQGLGFDNTLNDITCIDENTCYACGDIGKVIKTTDAGTTWEEQEVMTNNHLKKIYFLDSEYGFAAGQNGIVLKTTNGGENWDIIDTGLEFTIIEIYFENSDLGYVVSFTGEIAKTLDGGLNWERINSANYGVYDLKRAFIKDETVFGLQYSSIYKYDLSYEY